MPSPLGHALGGIAAGIAVGGLATSAGRSRRATLVTFGALGMAADLDLLVGSHSTYSHSLGAVGLVAALSALVMRGRPDRWRLAGAMAAAYASHLLLDWLNTDYAAPIGIMALWPFSAAHYHSGVALFPPVSRDVGAAWFASTNTLAALVELLILGPIALLAIRARLPRPKP